MFWQIIYGEWGYVCENIAMVDVDVWILNFVLILNA